MDRTDSYGSNASRIDDRILKHLLRETADLLEESQTHALVETPNSVNAHVLAQATWRMTTTCCWVLAELQPMAGENGQSERLQAPAPIFSRDEGEISPQLAAFIMRVDRLHDRARKLEELSRGPMVSTAPAETEHEHEPASPEKRESAPIIALFDGDDDRAQPVNAVRQAHSRLNWILSARE